MIIHNDCLLAMQKMDSDSISAIVTDPPYGLGFMNQSWDLDLPHDLIWKEALRISKPGSFMLCFGGTRTYHRLTCAIQDAGWEIRDCLMWLYGNGFPKSKACLKPAYEPILLARKPGAKVRENFLNIKECSVGKDLMRNQKSDGKFESHNMCMKGHRTGRIYLPKKEGRWPANVMIDEETSDLLGAQARFFYCPKASSEERNKNCEHLETSINTDGDIRSNSETAKKFGANSVPRKNNHPTVKPLKLMEYLVKLVTNHENPLVLDPFAGSGTTLLACKNLGINYIGIEKEHDYIKIIEARLSDGPQN